MLLNDPQCSGEPLVVEKRQNPFDSRCGYFVILAAQAQHRDTGIPLGWVGMDVGKVEIESQQCPLLSTTDVDYAFVRLPIEQLFGHGVCIMPSGGEKSRQ